MFAKVLLFVTVLGLAVLIAYVLKTRGPANPPDRPRGSDSGLDSIIAAPAQEQAELPGAYIRSLPNGTHIGGDTSTAGRGQLTIVNGTSNDACVILMDSAKSVRVRMIYIRANSSATLRRLTAGSYRALFTLGSDWDQKERMFTRNAEYFDFGKELSFEETRDSRAIHYSVETITLQETPNGNAHSIGIPEGEFAASSRR